MGSARVSAITSDSRSVAPGVLFAAVPGQHVHGARFAAGAILAGAAAVVTDPEGAQIISTLTGVEAPLLVVPDVARRLGEIAAAVYGNPADRLRTFAITGTNGKTTTAFLLEHILASCGRVTGMIGTVALRLAGHEIPAAMTTPISPVQTTMDVPRNGARMRAPTISRTMTAAPQPKTTVTCW